jgi:hypothetical protein
MDIYDQATAQEELARDIALKAARAPIKRLIPNGACYNCDAGLSHAGEFCDADCRDDWQRRNGGV